MTQEEKAKYKAMSSENLTSILIKLGIKMAITPMQLSKDRILEEIDEISKILAEKQKK